jgi:hypothetical protein
LFTKTTNEHAVTDYRKYSILILRIIAKRWGISPINFGVVKSYGNITIELAIATQQTPMGCGLVSIFAHSTGPHLLFSTATLPPKGVEYPIQFKQKPII